MLKKAHELAKLCDAEVTVLIKDESGKTMYYNSSNCDLRTTLNSFKTVDEIKTSEDFLNGNTEDNSNDESLSNTIAKSVI